MSFCKEANRKGIFPVFLVLPKICMYASAPNEHEDRENLMTEVNNMSLVYCPECGHEISPSAVTCPNCGHPIHTPPPSVVERRVVVAQPPTRDGGVPPWL